MALIPLNTLKSCSINLSESIKISQRIGIAERITKKRLFSEGCKTQEDQISLLPIHPKQQIYGHFEMNKESEI